MASDAPSPSLTLHVRDDLLSHSAVLCARVLGCAVNIEESSTLTHPSGMFPILEGSSDGPIAGTHSIIRFLASNAGTSPLAKEFLGTKENRHELDQWFSLRNTELNESTDRALFMRTLASMNVSLTTRPFLLGTNITAADVVMYTTMHPTMSSFSPDEALGFPCVVRWFDYVQNLNEIRQAGVLPSVSFDLDGPVKAFLKSKNAKKGGAKGGQKGGAQPKGKNAKKNEGAPKKGKGAADGGGKGKAKGNRRPKAAPAPAAPPIVQCDFRVGLVVKVERHPDADGLFLEQIDLGEEKPRQVVSGLVGKVEQSRLEGHKVICLCNLKPSNLKKKRSEAMVLCGSTDEKVELLTPPEDAVVGERLTFEGYEGEPVARLNPKKKIFKKLQPQLLINDKGVACFKEADGGKLIPFMTSKGPISVDTLKEGTIG